MAYQAFYRVYRPQTFREVSGQTHVKRTLQNALEANKTTHAYLFSGPRGTGKTSMARIFAKALNCEHAVAGEPCNECAHCQEINEGKSNDVFEYDAASNSRVEDMREMLEFIDRAPSYGMRYKIYIIDEVHMLSTSAFNALLKTLEEPPAHVVFILATTEPHKIPATIISRTQRFDFKRLSSTDLVERMKVVLEDIDLDYDDRALKVIAQAAAGGMRDSLSMLDQVVSFSDNEVTLEDALFVTGSIGQDVFYELAQSLVAKDIANVLATLEKLMSEGKDAVRLSEDLITFFRDLLLIQTAPDLGDLVELASSDDKFTELANNFSMDTLYTYIDILSKTQQEMRFSLHSKVYLETALLKMVQSGVSRVTTAENTAGAPEVAALQQQLNELQQLVLQMQKGGIVQQAPAPKEPSPRRSRQRSNEYQVQVGRIQEIMKRATRDDLRKIQDIWPNAVAQIPKSQAALLTDAQPVASSADAFVLQFKEDIYCQIASDNQQFMQQFPQVIAGMTGMTYDIVFVPEQRWLKLREEFFSHYKKTSPQQSTEENKSTSGEEAEENVQSMLVEEQQASANPIVDEAVKLFGKDFVEVVED
ncbi:DNA polymerase III subunit gamma/tau [Kurthia huakuii]|uniref:DNA polymerase III subunit gamma/tau n=1 Tax=Kurthia huakuii TaxID=1421019 RepID=UPI0004962AD6|nr:DNA polymerase III subunit gamma/tau [Kurthia huakuii]MBM7701054.1 DNA polymerase-3 subunit gamma/tau [Kurthia huakuii]